MIKNLNFLGKPNRDKLNLFISIGSTLFLLGIVDVTLNSVFEINITSFLPKWINYFTPILFGYLGLYYLRIDFSGNKRYSDFKQAYHYVADLKSEVQVQKVNPQLIQLLNSNVKAGPESFSVWEEDIEKAKNGDNKAVEQIEYGYFWYGIVCDAIVAWAASGLFGLNKRESFIDATGSEFGDMTYNEDLEETIKWIGAGMSFTIKRFYKKLPDFWDSNK